VILLDLIMPNMNGFQFLDHKSQDPALRDIPVIVTSARDPSGHPIVSNALAVTKGSGLSAPQLLSAIEAVSEIFSPPTLVGDPGPPAAPAA
jgi:CheY-like chemotaxis protein